LRCESSTGGLISASLLAVPGASAYFLGGAVVYTRDARRLLMDIPDDAMKGIRSASEPYAKLLASQSVALRHRLGPLETGATGPPATATATPPAIAAWPWRGPQTVFTLETEAPTGRPHRRLQRRR
jgi:nicotinamide mononucleotide (NMN) deamidase PncC